MKLTLFFLFLSYTINFYVESRLFYEKCCLNGKSLGQKSSCTSPGRVESKSSQILELVEARNSLCTRIFDICCAKASKDRQCDLQKELVVASGVDADCENVHAYSSSLCTQKCCNCCKVGVAFAQSKGTCNVDYFSDHECVKTAKDCCSKFLINKYDGSCDKHSKCLPQCYALRNQKIRCVCRQGFRLLENMEEKWCIDIDECTEASHSCHEDEVCENNHGSFKCRKMANKCSYGFKWSVKDQNCIDVDECADPKFNACNETMRCENTQGSYVCRRMLGCGVGYTLDMLSQECKDIDECELHLHNCPKNFACLNTKGSFRCIPLQKRPDCHPLPGTKTPCASSQQRMPTTCPPGFQLDQNGKCIDIDECERGRRCKANQRCINFVGSYQCRDAKFCHQGYEINESGTSCIDIDECLTQTHSCSPSQVCVNLAGSYTCRCPENRFFNKDAKKCEQRKVVNKCFLAQSQRKCACPSGFKYSSQYSKCIDIDECSTVANICDHDCINLWGSHQCICNQGYELASDQRSCRDIDECNSPNGSPCMSDCFNLEGSFKCSCPEGYKLMKDGVSCKDVDECQATKPSSCKSEELCVNTPGSYKCNEIVCPDGYTKDADAKNRCTRKSVICDKFDYACLSQPLSYSYNYISFPAQVKLPTNGLLFFTLTGLPKPGATLRFEIIFVKSLAASQGVKKACVQDFYMKDLGPNRAGLYLKRSLQGYQEVEVQVKMKVYYGNEYRGFSIVKIIMYISPNWF